MARSGERPGGRAHGADPDRLSEVLGPPFSRVGGFIYQKRPCVISAGVALGSGPALRFPGRPACVSGGRPPLPVPASQETVGRGGPQADGGRASSCTASQMLSDGLARKWALRAFRDNALQGGAAPRRGPPPPPPPLSCQGSQRPRFHPARGDVGQRRGASAQGHDAAWTRTRGIPSGHEKAPAPFLCLSTEGAGMLYDDALGRGHQEHLVWQQWPVHTHVEPRWGAPSWRLSCLW